MKPALLLAATVIAIALTAGCSSSGDEAMSKTDTQHFNGTAGTPMTPQKQQAITNFQEDFKKKHPQSGGPGQPPAGAPPAGG